MDTEPKEQPVDTIASPPEIAPTPETAGPELPSSTAPSASLESSLRAEAAALGRLCMALIGSQSEAEDVLQETLLAAHRSFATYSGAGTLRAWLFGIARRQCARHLTRQSTRGVLLSSLPATEPSTPPDEAVELRRRAERARALLAEVRPSEREALVLRYVGELSFREVGEACGIDEAAARKRVSRALSRLRAGEPTENEP